MQRERKKGKEKSATVKRLHAQVHMDKEEKADTIEQLHSQEQKKYKVEIKQLHSPLHSFIQANFSYIPTIHTFQVIVEALKGEIATLKREVATLKV